MSKRLKILALLWTVLLANTGCGQDRDDHRFKEIEKYYIKAGRPSGQINLPIHFSSIHVYDRRPDTSHLGMPYSKGFSVVEYRLKNETLTELVRYHYGLLLAPVISMENTAELHCFIKTLSLSDFISVPLDPAEVKASNGKFDKAEKSGLKIRIEFFIKKGNDFIPAYRFDSTVCGDKDIYKKGELYLGEGLTASLRKAATIDWAKLLSKGRKVNWEAIENNNKEEAGSPILQQSPAKGVFVSFDDFKNNKVTYTDFSVNKDDKGDYLYLKNKAGEEVLFTDLWGYSDGKDIFIYSANNFFKLFRSGNTYRFYGAKDYSKDRLLRMNFGLLDLIKPGSSYSKAKTMTTYDLIKNFLQLDMQNGELY